MWRALLLAALLLAASLSRGDALRPAVGATGRRAAARSPLLPELPHLRRAGGGLEAAPEPSTVTAPVAKEGGGGGGLPPWLTSFGTASLGGLLFGSDIGASSSVVRILGQGEAGGLGALDTFQLGQVASASLLGAMAASAALIYLGDSKIGRKLELQAASVLFFAGTLVQSLSPTFALVILGRCLYGLGIGAAMHVAPLYIAETAPDNLRGKLVSLKEAAIVGGIVLGYGAGALFGGNADGWRTVYESVLPLEVLMALGAFTLAPESPRWLALRGRPVEAEAAIRSCQGLTASEATAAVQDMTRAAAAGAGAGAALDNTMSEKLREIFSSPYNRQALVIGIGLVLFQQLSGQPSVLYFANRIFEKAGLGFEAALGVGCFKLLMTVASAALVEDPRFGRRSLLLYGNAGITASLAGLTALYATAGEAGPNQAAIIACILVFVGCYQIGFGPITWLVLSEIFPLRVRSAAVSMGTLANFGSNLLVALLFETERESLGESVLFGQFALIAAAATAFTFVNVFETRGLSLEGIELKLRAQVDERAAKQGDKSD